MALFGKRQVQARVTGVAWSRVVQLECQEWVAKRRSWVPSDDVRNVQRHSESYWETVTDTQPLGMQMPGLQQPGMPQQGMPGMQQPGMPGTGGLPGSSMPQTRTELRSRTYFTYEALEWHQGRSLRAWGTAQEDVAWPEYSLEPRERVGNREESYSATLMAGDKRYEVALPEQEWRALPPGGSCQLTLGLLGGVKKVTPADGS